MHWVTYFGPAGFFENWFGSLDCEPVKPVNPNMAQPPPNLASRMALAVILHVSAKIDGVC